MNAVIRNETSYMYDVFADDLGPFLRRAREDLKDVDFDTIVGRGLSGALIIPTLARYLGKHWAIVRKKGDGSHDGRAVVGRLGKRWLFVDDFIDSGETQEACQHAITKLAKDWRSRVIYVGSYEYSHGDLTLARTASKATMQSEPETTTPEPMALTPRTWNVPEAMAPWPSGDEAIKYLLKGVAL